MPSAATPSLARERLLRARRLFTGDPDHPALITSDRRIDYAELSRRVEQRGAELGSDRRLVMITAANAIEPVITYLAALEGRHPVLLLADGEDASGHRRKLIDRFDPDVVADDPASGALHIRRDGSRHVFHPDLAMLASTSGSTGSPKLVRLSMENLHSNAAAIAEYLRLTPVDRAATTLPLHYCYGLSVLNSHLAVGASVFLTERSVTEDDFWQDFVESEATSFAGVPHTFDLLDASGFAHRDFARLRYVTQAGGRLPPDRVRRYARLGRERGFELFVMYGQTEATARMGYLPPSLAETAPETIGRAIPGGAFDIDPSTGELIYRGPNVMMGYAHDPSDFARGRTTMTLRTGDVARRRDDGLIEIVGRLNRFAKFFGLRIDLDRVETHLAEEGIPARAVAVDDRLIIFVLVDRLAAEARRRVAEFAGIPPHVIDVHRIAEFPRTRSGKNDSSALERHARALATVRPQDDETAAGPVTTTTIRDLYARLLGRPDATEHHSFSDLDGDSLSYVEVAVRLESLLGMLPHDWPSLSPAALAGLCVDDGDATPRGAPATAVEQVARDRTRRHARLDTAVVLRAAAIVLIVGSHADLFSVQGGAHLLLAVLGFNLARFQLADRSGRSRALLRSSAQIAIPAVVWIGAVTLLTGHYAPTTVALVNGFLPGQEQWSIQWSFWFLEFAVWGMLGLAALFAWPRADRLERAHPFGCAVGLLTVALAVRFAVTGVETGLVERYTIAAAGWLLVLGWAAARATRVSQRVALSAVAVVGSAGFVGNPAREGVIIAGILVLLWIPAVTVPRMLVPAVTTLAGASLFIYLTHWQVFPAWEETAPLAGTLLSLVVGVAAWCLYRAIERGVLARFRSRVRAAGAVPTRSAS